MTLENESHRFHQSKFHRQQSKGKTQPLRAEMGNTVSKKEDSGKNIKSQESIGRIRADLPGCS